MCSQLFDTRANFTLNPTTTAPLARASNISASVISPKLALTTSISLCGNASSTASSDRRIRLDKQLEALFVMPSSLPKIRNICRFFRLSSRSRSSLNRRAGNITPIDGRNESPTLRPACPGVLFLLLSAFVKSARTRPKALSPSKAAFPPIVPDFTNTVATGADLSTGLYHDRAKRTERISGKLFHVGDK